MIGLNNNFTRYALRQMKAASIFRFMSKKCSRKTTEKEKCKKALDGFPCGKPKLMGEPKPVVNEAKMSKPPSIWLNPFCEEDAVYCPFNPRFDDIYYVESDKAKRKYWQTWVSCPPLQIKKKKICCFEKLKAIPVRRRKHSTKPKTACPQPPACESGDVEGCKKIKRRCHRDGRIPPDCLKAKRPLVCTKPLTPYPAFSECVRMKPNALPLSECICWKKPMICEAWAEWRRRSMNKMHQKN
ncbi:hypothetical protein KR222_010002 [Zaprionus bogoriensis]|nr:hypothetical protein KR222_010002 [Zaprionus bogoriensis]